MPRFPPMKRVVRIGPVAGQDRIRREDLARMTPAERVDALLAMRDHAFPNTPLQRVASVRFLT